MRWLILLYADLACLVAVLIIPRSEVVLRTYVTVILASIGIAGYIYQKYHMRFGITVDVLTSMNVMAQFLLPSLYLVSVSLERPFALTVLPYLDYFPDAALAALLGQSLFFAGYEGAGMRDKLTERNRSIELVTPTRFLCMMVPVVSAVWISRVILLQTGSYYHLLPSRFMFESPLYSILRQLSSYGIFVLAGLWIIFFSGSESRQSRRSLAVAASLTLLEFLWYFPSGSREPVLALMAVVLFAYVVVRQRFPMKWTALGILAALLLLSFTHFYRYAIRSDVDPWVISLEDTAQTLRQSGPAFLEQDFQTGIWLTRSAARLADARSVAAILKSAPLTIPYLNGETYARLPWVIVPRFVYPDKPEAILPIQRFGLFLEEGGSSPTTLVGEAHLNFGWIGLFFVMPLVGWISRRYDLAFLRRFAHPVWAAIYVGMATQVVRLPVQPVAVWLGVFIKSYLLAVLLVMLNRSLNRIWAPK